MSRVFSTSLAESVHHRSSFLSWRGHSSDTLLIPLTYNSTHPRYRLAFHLETVLREASILISIYLPKSLFYSYLYFPSWTLLHPPSHSVWRTYQVLLPHLLVSIISSPSSSVRVIALDTTSPSLSSLLQSGSFFPRSRHLILRYPSIRPQRPNGYSTPKH